LKIQGRLKGRRIRVVLFVEVWGMLFQIVRNWRKQQGGSRLLMPSILRVVIEAVLYSIFSIA